ncbi:MAG TPA: ethanolamine ammonia-lyase subunit EutC [Pirellulales bacterium]|nr:ethanolamine ammonia-lyase subunit EutC [Pirellulales bacterium]
MGSKPVARPDPWSQLRTISPARIALGRAGGSLPTHELLDFQLAHARARDAVNHPFDPAALAERISALGLPTVVVHSAAVDRRTYLERPDLGRQLSPECDRSLVPTDPPPDLVLIVSDGLSALAAERQVVPLFEALLPRVRTSGWRLAPIVVAALARVAMEDDVGQRLGARAAAIFLGERPGLGAPDGLGAYLVYDPRPGRSDADRNCVSNIRPEGLPPAAAAETIHYLLGETLRRKISGIALKDERPALDDARHSSLTNRHMD